MNRHPMFLIIGAKLNEAQQAVDHMQRVHDHQCALRSQHPEIYLADVHAESIVTNVQGIYTQFEGILKRLTSTIDGFSPSGESWHRDLLLQASSQYEGRPQMIGPAALNAMTDLLLFRHAVRNNYATRIRHPDVFRNLSILQQLAPVFVSDIVRFMDAFSSSAAVISEPPPPPQRSPS